MSLTSFFRLGPFTNRPALSFEDISPVRDLISHKALQSLSESMKSKAETISKSRKHGLAEQIKALGNFAPWEESIRLPTRLWTTCLENGDGESFSEFETLAGRLDHSEAAKTKSLIYLQLIKRILPPVADENVCLSGSMKASLAFMLLKENAGTTHLIVETKQESEKLKWLIDQLEQSVDILDLKGAIEEKYELVFNSNPLSDITHPFATLSVMINHALKYIVFDQEVIQSLKPTLELRRGNNGHKPEFLPTDGLIMEYFCSLGISPENVRRYTIPGISHMFYIVDIRNRKV